MFFALILRLNCRQRGTVMSEYEEDILELIYDELDDDEIDDAVEM